MDPGVVISTIFQFLSQRFGLVLVAWLSCVLFLFLPDGLMKRLGLNEIPDAYRFVIGVAFLISSSYVIIHITEIILKDRKRKNPVRKLQRKIRTDPNFFDPKEQAILREFSIQGQDALRLPIGHPNVASLIHKGILTQIADSGICISVGRLGTFSIRSELNDYISNESIGLPSDPTDEQMESIAKSRPDFLFEILEHEQRRSHSSWGLG